MRFEKTTVVVTHYIAEDGTIFTTYKECREYEVSKLALFKRLAINAEFVSYYGDSGDLCSAYCENDAISAGLEDYTNAVVLHILAVLGVPSSHCTNEKVKSSLGLV